MCPSIFITRAHTRWTCWHFQAIETVGWMSIVRGSWLGLPMSSWAQSSCPENSSQSLPWVTLLMSRFFPCCLLKTCFLYYRWSTEPGKPEKERHLENHSLSKLWERRSGTVRSEQSSPEESDPGNGLWQVLRTQPEGMGIKLFPEDKAHPLSYLGWELSSWKRWEIVQIRMEKQYNAFKKSASITFPWMWDQKPGSALKEVEMSCAQHFQTDSFQRQVLYWQIQ